MDRRREALACVAEDAQGRSWSLIHLWEVSLHKLATSPMVGLSFDFMEVTADDIEVHRHKAASRVWRARCHRIGRAVGLGLVLSLEAILPSL